MEDYCPVTELSELFQQPCEDLLLAFVEGFGHLVDHPAKRLVFGPCDLLPPIRQPDIDDAAVVRASFAVHALHPDELVDHLGNRGFRVPRYLGEPAEGDLSLFVDRFQIGDLPDRHIRQSAFGEDLAGALVPHPEKVLQCLKQMLLLWSHMGIFH